MKPVHQDTDIQCSTKEKNENKTFFYHFRTTVNRRTFVGRAGRTNEERV